MVIEQVLEWFGLVRKAHMIETLDFARREAKRLDEQREAVETTTHLLIEQTRYTLQAASVVLQEKDRIAGQKLHNIAQWLPYILSGQRHLQKCPADTEINNYVRINAEELAREYGFELPSDSGEAVLSLLEIASMLCVPSFTFPVEGLKIRYPLRNATAA